MPESAESRMTVDATGAPPPTALEIQVLGPLEVRRNGASVAVGGPKQRSILAMLIANQGQPVSLDRIVDDLYDDDSGGGARRSVQTFISLIRKEVGDIIAKDRGGYVLAVPPGSVDAVRFEEQVRAALDVSTDDPEIAATALRDALSMWRGLPYADVEARSAFDAEITRLGELRLSAIEARINADLAAGRHAELVGELDGLTVEYPLREHLRAQQMLALYRCGRQTEALRAFERARNFLAEEIGVDPSPELRELEQRILDHDPALGLPVTPSVTERVVMAVEVADPATLMRLDPAERTVQVQAMSEAIAASVERHRGEGFAQRGAAMYAAFALVDDAVAAVNEAIVAPGPTRPRIALDWGDVEIHESGDVTGPPVRRTAGLIAAAHPGQVLLSADAHAALTAADVAGWAAKSLGSHPVYGIDGTQRLYQLLVGGTDTDFPPPRIDANPPALPVDRRAIAGYELRRPISTDLTGTTYAAYQPSVGRQVAVTVIDPAWANEADFIRRFEVETQLVTRLQHPHIVPVLDYWRDPTGAYLVMPRVGSTTLAQLLDQGGLDDAEQRRTIVGQLGAALAYAHEAGIVHGGFSPDAVLVDSSGNAYLTGIGFVLRLAGAPRPRSRYTAPETRDGGPVDAAADVFALGVLVGELLDDVDPVAAQATATDLADRFASVAELITQLGGASAKSAAEPAFTVTRNPYKGLEAFSESDSGDFFGRTQAVADLVTQVAAHRLVAVVGPSGSGKSSLVRAGLIPAVRSGDLDGSQQWLVTAMLPGSYPFEELESALARVAVKDPGGLMDELARDERGLVRVIKRVLPADTRLLLVIDQFEEVFTLTRNTETRDRFLRALVAVAADDRADVRVVVTLRADFFDRPLQHPEFGALLTAGMFAITTPSADDLAEAVRRPAETVGVGFETGLVEQIVADVADAPGSLPLLQYALTELFAARTSDVLTHDHYRATGGVLGALGTRADSIHDQLDPNQRALARQVFLRMVTVQASGEPTRRRARLPELNAVADPSEVNVILTAFGDARLLTFDRDPLTRSPSAEVAHEAMLTRWPHLADWIFGAREDLLLHQRVADSVTEWANHDRSDDYLLTGGRLAQFQTWAATTDLTLTTDETTYLDHSTQRDDHQRATRRRRRNLVTTGFAIVAVVATLAGILAFISRQDAADKADQANVATLISRSEAARADEPTVSVLLALEAHRRAPGPETEGAVLTAMSRLGPLVRTFPPFPPVDESGGPPKRESSWGSADGFSQSSQIDGRAVRLSLVTGEIFDIGELPEPDAQWVGDQDADRGFAHSLDSSRFWLGPYAGPWDTEVEPAQPMALLDEALASNRVVMATHVGAYMGNGFWDVAGDETTTVVLIDATTGEQVGPGIEGVRALNQVTTAISSDAAMIAVGMLSSGEDDSSFVVVLDAETGAELSRFDVPALISRMVFDTAAGELIVATYAARLVTIDVESGEIIADVATSIGSEIVGLGLRSDGGVVVVGLGLAEIVDRRRGPTGEPSIELLGGGSVVRPDDTLVVTEASGQIEVYDFGSGALVEQRVALGPDGYVAGIGLGRALVDTNGRFELVDLATNERAEVESVPEEFYLPISILAEGTGGIIIGPDGYRLGQFESGQLVEQVAMAPADFQLFRGEIDDQLDLGAGVFLRPDGGFEVQVQNVAPGQVAVTLRLDVEAEPAAYPAPDGGVYVTLGAGTFRHYDSTGSVVSEIDTGIFNPYLAALDHGSGRVAFAAGTVIGPDSAVIIDPATGEMHTIPDIGGVAKIEFARDGELLVMMGFDGSVRLWNVEQQEFAGVIWDGTGARFNEALHYDESTDSLWVPSSGQLLRLPLNPARWLERACEFVGRDFTKAEWDEYVPGGGAVQSACA